MSRQEHSVLIKEATLLFQSEREFLLSIYNEKDPVKLMYRLTHATTNQVKCIIFILFFIVRKLIPINRSVFQKIPLEVLKNMKKKFDHPFQVIYDEGREEHMIQIIAIHTYLPEMIQPMLRDIPKLDDPTKS